MGKKTREKIKAARKRLKKHLKNKGENGDFDLTQSFCLYWWHRLNASVFDGMLTPPVRFELRCFRDFTLGWCKPWRPNAKQRRVIMGLNTDIGERKDFLMILAHEMVHQWEWEIKASWEPNVAHGKRFFTWRKKLEKRTGLPLESTY